MPRVEAFAKELAALPVMAVLTFTAIKDGFEDLKRFRADKRVNSTETSVFSVEEGTYVMRKWADIRPGDFVKLHTNEVIPADILLLKSSDISGMCHIETANLDGETNLKQRECVRSSHIHAFTPEEFLWPVEVEAPNAELYHFSGRIHTPVPTVVRKENMLLRGCILRNTDSVEGMVIYAGRETKTALNNSSREFKRSELEKRLNRDIIWCILILAILCITGSVGSYIWLSSLPGANIPFLKPEESDNIVLSAFINFWTFVIILQAVIPLPLYITVEGVKVLQIFFMEHDLGLYDARRDRRIETHAFNIPEDLGQIEYVFCDKTGTLTENKMVFKRAVINGIDYWVDEELPVEVLDENVSQDTDVTIVPGTRLSAVRDFIPFVPPSSINAQTTCGCVTSHSSPSLGSMPPLVEENRTNAYPPQPSFHTFNGGDEEAERHNCQRVQDFFLCLTICNSCVVSANKNVPAPLVPLRKRNPFSRLRRGMKSKGFGDEVSSSSRFRRFFIRGSRDEIFEVGKEAIAESERDDAPVASETGSTDFISLDRSIHKSLSINSLFAWRQRKSDASTWETGGGERQSTRPPKRVLCALTGSPQQKEGKWTLKSLIKFKSSNAETVGNLPDIVATLSGTQEDNESERTGSFSIFSDDERVSEPQARPARQPLFQPKARPVVAKQFKGQSCSQQPAPVFASGCDDWEALSQVGLSTRWRSSNSSLVDRPFHHICPLSENTLLNGYESESPDEVTLVKTACKYGCKLLQRGTDFVIIWLPGDGLIRVEVLKVLPFTTKRKRMSIIIRHPNTDEIVLYCKGADSVILPLLDPQKGQSFKSSTEERLNGYSRSGLRTLVMAKRVLLESEYQKWAAAWSAAEQDYLESEELKYKLMEDIEVNLELLGATGIEDSLQEGVPETIAALREAGMKVWVLTGDKQETATSIAYAAKLITEEQRVLVLSAATAEEAKHQLENFLVDLLPGSSMTDSTSNYQDSSSVRRKYLFKAESESEEDSQHQPFPSISIFDNEVAVNIPQEGIALVLDSTCLPFVLEEKNKGIFIKLARICSSVICCRVTPSQKASVVKLVKHELGVRTLAVGDGANDVNMIQCADVGVGISGQEGMQASMASDFAITQFAFLKRLLLVHGHWCYEKLARMALYMFYKDAVYIFSLFWFQFFNGFSGSAHINQLAQVLFNITLTSIPPFILGALDNSLDDRTLMANPKLYRNGRDSMTYRPWHFWLNTLDAVWQSLVIFFIPCLVLNGTNASMDELGTTCMNALVFTALVHIALETKCFTVIHAITYVGSYLVLWLFFTMAYNALGVTQLAPDPPYYVIFVLMKDSRFWLCMLITSTTALLPRLLLNSTLNTFAPSLDTLAARLQKKYGVGVTLPIGRYVEEHDACQRRRCVRRHHGLRMGEPNNIRSRVARWFTSAGRLIQRMPTLRRHIDEPSVVLVRNVSLVWPRRSSNPELVAHTLPRVDSTTFTSPRDLRRSNTYNGRTVNSNREDWVTPYMTRTSEEAFICPAWDASMVSHYREMRE
ncbi:putative phospholipid-transporting ATPase VA [Taenia crassiceps]|uniref:Phospholipid-transporting ATPase n=1 Tax=Taenia crassiceps TaxID=6207 RepID=A0ABR4Q449_9CEST